MAGSWGLIEALKTWSRRLRLYNLSGWMVRCVCCRMLLGVQGVSPCLCVVWCPCRLGYDRWLFYFRCGNAMRAVSWCTVHLVMSSCGVTVTSLSLCIFNCGLPSFDQFREFSAWCHRVYVFSRRVCVMTTHTRRDPRTPRSIRQHTHLTIHPLKL
jgi:hypothetical protein